MPITHQDAFEIFQSSLDLFLEHECDQIFSNVHEVNLCGRLAIYMQQAANHLGPPRYFADPEYNRQQNGQIKTILDDQMQVVTVSCDLVLHSRGAVVSGDNLIAVEMRKTERPSQEKKLNRVRLRALTKKASMMLGVPMVTHILRESAVTCSASLLSCTAKTGS